MKIKFITINIWNGGRLFDNLFDFLKKEDADIIAMQEVYNGKNEKSEKRFRSFNELKKELKYKYSSFAAELIDKSSDNAEFGNAVFSKFPITSQKIIFYDVSFNEFNIEDCKDFQFIPHNIQYLKISVKSIKLNLFNTHGIWGLDGRDNKRRIEMSDIITNEIKGKENVILAGDFNTDPNTITIYNIEKYLNNIFKNQLKSSFNMKRKNNSGYANAVVDMIFISKNIKDVNHYCPSVDVSDHLPLVVILDI